MMLPSTLSRVCRVLPSTLQESNELKLDFSLKTQRKKAAEKKKAFLEQNIMLK